MTKYAIFNFKVINNHYLHFKFLKLILFHLFQSRLVIFLNHLKIF
jgi:hypothetical protein